MPYTFGAAATDDITASMPLTSGGDNNITFCAGWWYPTTLTATRGYWSVGNTYGAEVDTTTSEIRMRTDNTTDGQWVTSGAGITTNKWWFIAWLAATENTTVAGAWRVWVGDADTRPLACTITNPTVRSGNYTANTNLYAGNKGTGSLAFQGDIGWMSFLNTNAVGCNTAFGIATSGVIADAEAAVTYDRWVMPMWRGTPTMQYWSTATEAASFTINHWNLESTVSVKSGHTNAIGQGSLTINGATYTSNSPPTRPPLDWPNTYPLRRR